MIYDSSGKYITSAATTQERLARVEQIIDKLLALQLDSADGKSGIEEYSLDDGQTVIRTRYRSAKDIESAIQAYRRYKNDLLRELNGGIMRLRDFRNFPPYQ